MISKFFGKNTQNVSVEFTAEEVLALREELNTYRLAFKSLSEVTKRVKRGDMEARVVDWDSHGNLSGVLAEFNQVLDLTDAFVRESTASLTAATSGSYYRKFLETGMLGSFGEGARLMNETVDQMRISSEEKLKRRTEMSAAFEQSIGSVVQTLSATTSQVSSTARRLKSLATENQALASNVAAAAEEATVNVQTVSAAAEQLSASVKEITRQVNASSSRTTSAFEEASLTSSTISELKSASESIGMAVDLIKDIADQTNLLALNATIEAARAGDAGKGFAVVASEVKNLAQQTTKATGEVDTEVQSIQDSTNNTVEAVQNIEKSIHQLNEIASAIASATEEQSSATLEISRNIQEASQGTSEVSSNISKVYESASETLTSADELETASGQLDITVQKLQNEAQSFLTEINNG